MTTAKDSKNTNERLKNRRYVIDDEVLNLDSLASATVPKELVDCKPSTKILYFFLEDLGLVDYQQGELSEALGISRQSVSAAFDELDTLKLIDYKLRPVSKSRAVYQIVS